MSRTDAAIRADLDMVENATINTVSRQQAVDVTLRLAADVAPLLAQRDAALAELAREKKISAAYLTVAGRLTDLARIEEYRTAPPCAVTAPLAQ